MGLGAGLYTYDVVVKKSSRSLSHLLMRACYFVCVETAQTTAATANLFLTAYTIKEIKKSLSSARRFTHRAAFIGRDVVVNRAGKRGLRQLRA